ncbi:macro domain-containing protein, partial [Aliivibrio fischeri]
CYAGVIRLKEVIMKTFRLFVRNTLLSLGITSSIVTVLWAIFSAQLNDLVKDCEWLFLGSIIIINIIYGVISVLPKNSVKLKLGENLKVDVGFGDLFQKEGVVVIPVNDYFDTLVDEKVVSSNTIHGIFVKRFFSGNEKLLKRLISASLKNIVPVEVNKTRKQGNHSRYALGTVACVPYEGKRYFLVALTKFNENYRAEVTKSEYQRVLCDLFDYIEQNSQGNRVNVPLIGGGHSGLELPKQKLLEFLLLSITLNDKLTLINGLDIVLHQSVKDEVSLNIIESYYQTL